MKVICVIRITVVHSTSNPVAGFQLPHDAQNIMTIGVYRINNLVSGKCYIGSSFEVEQRIVWHYRKLLTGKHINKHLQYAYNLYGKDVFTHEILEAIEFTSNDTKENDTILRVCEQKYIDSVDSSLLYNQCLVAGSTKGRKHSQETRAKISTTLKNSNKGKISFLKGKKLSEEHKKKLSHKKIGGTNKLKGTETLRGRKAIIQIDRCTNQEIKEFDSAKEANKATGIHITDISKCCNNKLKQAGGYIWKFKSDC